jgi:hypothetical protein
VATKKKKKVIKNPRVPRTHNGGTMTKAQFFSMITSSLRQLSRWYKPIQQVKQAAKRIKPKNVHGRHKVEFLCNGCGKYFKNEDCNVDHLVEAGGIRDFSDIQGFCERLFCDNSKLQVLCSKGVNSCHTKKTQDYMKRKRELKKGGINEK